MAPKISVFSLGGTIAMGALAPGKGVSLSHSAEMLIDAIPELSGVAEISAQSFRQVPSPDITIDDLEELAQLILEHLANGVGGVVVTQGTDTIEESAFVLDRIIQHDAPVVLCGAMRNPTMMGADGPANLYHAVIVASHPTAQGLGTMVVMNDEVHAARYVQKLHTTNPAAFISSPGGPLGWVLEAEANIISRVSNRYPIKIIPQTLPSKVARLTVGIGDDGTIIELAVNAGYNGLVIDTTGGGHVPKAMVDALEGAAKKIPVVFSSRTRHGSTMRSTYNFPGAETDLISRGLIPAGWLNGIKARLLLMLLLRSGADRRQIESEFEDWNNPLE